MDLNDGTVGALNTGQWTVDTGYWTLDTGHWTLVTGL
jgi:hypothetical protein